MDRTFGKAYIDYIYDYIIEKEGNCVPIEETSKRLIKEVIEKEIFTGCFKSLLYCLNSERVEKKLKGDTPKERYDYFNHTKYCVMAMEKYFPAMKEQLYVEMRGKWKFILSVLENLKQERERICKHFFITEKEEPVGLEHAGDWHNDKCVLIVTFQSGKKLVFKPTRGRNLEFLRGFLQFFFEEGYLELYDSLSMEKGTWVKFVEHREVTSRQEIEQFYLNYGKLLFSAYMLGMNDMHYENLIAHGIYPVMTDVETVFSSYLFFGTHRFEYDAQYEAVKKLLYGVMATGLVPVFSMTEYFGGDVSCLSNRGIRLMVEKVKNEYRDDMSLYTAMEQVKQYGHLPEREVEPLRYGTQIMQGFDEAAEIYRNRLKEIQQYVVNNFNMVEARIILNMTKGYSKILRIKSDPRYRFKPELFGQLLERLKRSNQFNESVYQHEVEELCVGNIPSFYWNAKENCVYGCRGDEVAEIMKVAAFAGEASNGNGFDENILIKIMDRQWETKNLKEQRKLIAGSIRSSIVLEINYQREGNAATEWTVDVEADIYLRRNMDENRILGKDGTISWIGLMVNDKEQLEYAILDWSLYSGLIGIGYMYLSEYLDMKDKKVPDESAVDSLRRLYHTFVKAWELGTFDDYNISYFCGLTGIYAFLKKLKESGLIEESEVEGQLDKVRERIRQNIPKTSCFDTLSGVHSAVIYYFGEREADCFGMEMITAISKHFLQNFKIDFMEQEFDYASFAHGYSGVMTSLMCMNAIQPRTEYTELIHILYEKEQMLYQGEFQWVDRRKEETQEMYSHFWCHGSCGIMQSRLIWLKYGFLKDDISELLHLEEEELKTMLSEYKRGIEGGVYQSQNHSLCHGNFAFVDFLLSYEKVTGVTACQEYCKEAMEQAAGQGYSCVGAPGAINAIGFMVGEAGIQYVLNRYKQRNLKSVLVMETI